MSKYVPLNINKTSRSFYYFLVSTLQQVTAETNTQHNIKLFNFHAFNTTCSD